MSDIREMIKGLADEVQALKESMEAMQTSFEGRVADLEGMLYGYLPDEEGIPEDETEEQRATRIGLSARLGEMEALVKGRNRSAPTKRNMTDADALAVLNGAVATLEHKDAGEQIGLTYAQVYSCRLEYTFKHVHKQLRDAGWKNPWRAK
jgi:hypothetical protein